MFMRNIRYVILVLLFTLADFIIALWREGLESSAFKYKHMWQSRVEIEHYSASVK